MSPTSACLPFLTSDELTPWVYRQDLPDEIALRGLFRRWVSDVLAPRLAGGAGGAEPAGAGQ